MSLQEKVKSLYSKTPSHYETNLRSEAKLVEVAKVSVVGSGGVILYYAVHFFVFLFCDKRTSLAIIVL